MDKAKSNTRSSILDTIDSPADLRKLPVGELKSVCSALRDTLIASLSENPGHFASSMGAVELTVALHYVFNTPYDRIVWDVGHQAYSHKILTGRREAFVKGNRKLGGLSGFPNPAESEYDTFMAGHASNSISAALGMAVASQLNNEQPPRNVVAVIGDASISGGLAFEGINNAANTPNNLLIILNDNDMSIDRNVGSLNSYLSHITTSPAYNKIRYKAYKALRKLHLISEQRRGRILRLNNSLKSFINHEQNIFEGLNIRYFGPIDGHDVERLVRVLSDIKDMQGPRILHLRTVKGKGYKPAEDDPATWHAPGKFDPETGIRVSGTSLKPRLKYQDIFGRTLVDLARKDAKVVGITAAMPSGTSLSILQSEMPDRAFDVGISEGHAVTFAGGLAKEGMRPFVAIYSSFLQRAYDHIIHDVAIQSLPVTFCIDRAGLVGEDGVTHHGAFDMCYLRSIPNITVAAPRDGQSLCDLLYTAYKHSSGPFAIRYPRGCAPDIPSGEMSLKEIGRGERLADGDSVAVISIGAIADEVAKAVARLKENGIDAAHYDAVYVKPLDGEMMREIVAKGCPIVTVEDGAISGGFGSAVNEWLAEHGVKSDVTMIGIPDNFVTHGTVAQLKQLCGLDVDSIYDKIAKTANRYRK